MGNCTTCNYGQDQNEAYVDKHIASSMYPEGEDVNSNPLRIGEVNVYGQKCVSNSKRILSRNASPKMMIQTPNNKGNNLAGTSQPINQNLALHRFADNSLNDFTNQENNVNGYNLSTAIHTDFQQKYHINRPVAFNSPLQPAMYLNLVQLDKFPDITSELVAEIYEKLGPFQFKSDNEDDEEDILRATSSQIIIMGPFLYQNGACYEGEMREGLRHGRGRQLWKDGSLYEGFWQNDTAWGDGRLIHANGDVYFGEWQDDHAHGKGIYLHADGSQYQGEWFQDRQHGMGMETWADGTKYEGSYFLGAQEGEGVFTWTDGSWYEGQFRKNEIEGQGTYQWADLRVYVGDWQNNKMHGKGVFTWPDNRRYQGDYIEDQKEGFGVFIWPDGQIYQGYWKDGKQHGYGILKLSTGKEIKGYWNDGQCDQE